jgi:hypothetical protein
MRPFCGSVCAEALASVVIEARQMIRALAEGVKNLISGCIVFPVEALNRRGDSRFSLHDPDRIAAAARFPLPAIATLSRNIDGIFGNKIETRDFRQRGGGDSRHRRQVRCVWPAL